VSTPLVLPAAVALEDTPTEAAMPSERLAALFDAHHQRLYRLARRMSRDPEEARDLVQEVFLRAARRPAGLPADDPGGEAWLVRVLVNLCRDRARRLAVRARALPALAAPASTAGPESAAVARATVAAALARLTPRRRAVVVLHELEGLPVERIAKLLGVARVTVRWHLAAARAQLAAGLRSGVHPDPRPAAARGEESASRRNP
jgi:RNA polymerase sigma-70 factor (ECF subfamily)